MSFKYFLSTLLLLLSLVCGGRLHAQETEAELAEKALSFFDHQQFVEATPLYLRLLALNPLSHDYNFRYGTCLLYNSYKKQDAFKYLNYSVQDAGTDVAAYYYLGKAYHLNYQFNDAIKNYELYKQKAGPKQRLALDVDRQIEMCQNGKRLLTTITDIVVLEKKEIDAEKFFRIYDLRNIGGDLLVAAEYQSKIDKKKGHIPLIHFPADPSTIYYSSYGDSDTGQKDIYMKRKLPDGSWSLPQPVRGDVNTRYDEDYPYLHPNGQYLYFCSRGHNSMGGYDVFRSRIDPETGAFGPPENMDFAISSPDDDLFYVVDSLDANAYFASARQSSNGKLFVYKVRVDRVPLQLAVVKGNFASVINPENKKVSITVTDYASGEKIGTFNSNEKGNYLITFPKGGKYSYEIKIEGKQQIHKYLVSIPFSKEFRPLKQKMIEELKEETEVVRVLDLFNEDVDDIAGVLAEVIKMRSELNPNANQFDLQELDEQKTNARILAELGFENASPQQIASHFDAVVEKQEERVTAQQNLINGANSRAVENSKAAQLLTEQAKELVNRSNNAATEQQKYDLLEKAQEKLQEAREMKQEAKSLIAFADSIQKGSALQEENLGKIQAINSEVRKSVSENNLSDLKEILGGNTAFIAEISNSPSGNPVETLTEERKKLGAERQELEQQKNSYQATSGTLSAEIAALNKSLAEAKNKDKPGIQSNIDGKTAEKALVQEEIDRLDKKIGQTSQKMSDLEKKIEFLNAVTSVKPGQTVSGSEAKSALSVADDPNSRTLEAYVNQQIESLKKNPELLASAQTQTLLPTDVDPEYQNGLNAVTGNTPAEKLQAQNRVDEQLLTKIDAALAKAESDLAADPGNQQAKEQQQALKTLKSATEKQISVRKDQLAKEQLTASATKPTPASELQRLSPEYQSELNAATGSTPAEKLQAQNRVDEQLLTKIDAALVQVESDLAANPGNQQAKEQQQALKTLKSATEKQISVRKDQLAKEQLTASATKPTPASELQRLSPEYQDELNGATGNTPAEKLQAQNRIDEQLLTKINTALAQAESDLAADPGNQQVKEQQQALKTLKSATEKQISEREKEITVLAKGFTTTPEDERAKIFPGYEEERSAIQFTDRKEQLLADNTLDEQLIRLAREEQAEIEGQLLRNPENGEAKARNEALNELISKTQAKVDVRNAELNTLTVAVVESSPIEEKINQLRPEHQKNIEKILSANSEGPDREAKLLGEDEALLTSINTALEKARNELRKDPENAEKQQEIVLLDEARSIQEARVSERKLDLLAIARQSADTNGILAGADNQYAEKAGSGTVGDQIKLEKQHEQKLTTAIASNDKKLQKAFDPELAVQNEVLQAELELSGKRLEQLQSPENTNATADTKLRSDLGTNYERLMVAQPSDAVKAKQVLEDLGEYRSQLEDRLGEMPDENPEKPLVNQQLSAVRKRIGIVEADLDAMTHTAGISDPSSAEAKRNQLEARLSDPAVTSGEKKQIQKELTTLNKEIIRAKEERDQQELAGMDNTIRQKELQMRSAETSTPLSSAVLENTYVSNGKTPSEQLQKAEERNSLLSAVESFNETFKAFKESGLVADTRENLQAKKRRFSIEIGELEREIQKEQQKGGNQERIQRLTAEKDALGQAIADLDRMIALADSEQRLAKEPEVPANTEIPYARELELASDPRYRKIAAQSQNVEGLRKELAFTEKEMDAVRTEIGKEPNPEKREGFIAVLEALNEQAAEYRESLQREKKRLEETVTASGLPKEEIYNLLSRGVDPQELPVAEVPETLKNGFSILKNDQQGTSARDLKLENTLPKGLVYRVQVGAFAKPVPEDRFREFTPVTGEKLPSGITRYMAGYFSQRQTALAAMNQIRALGYADAFPVAYCNGERISLAEARRLEEAGLCKATSQDSLIMEIATAQQQKEGVQPRIEPKPGDYNKAEGAAPADAAEERQGLFFTVQVGVYNRPATTTQLREISPLITKRLPNGQIRYSSGIFPSAEAARPKRQEAVLRGIEDAFIVAYYKGERITVQEANRLLAEQGTAILEKAVPEQQEIRLDSARTYLAENPVMENQTETQLTSKRVYEEYPVEEIARLNVNGNYYYDAEDRRIKSIPSLAAKAIITDTNLQIVEVRRNFERKQAEIVSVWAGNSLNGALADWLLHATTPYECRVSDGRFELRFEGVADEQQAGIIEELKKLGAVSVTTERD